MKNLIHIIRTAASAAISILTAFAVQPAFAATTVYLDQNGTSPGFWDQATTNINCDVTASVTWTTDPTGVAAPKIGAVGDNFQFGIAPSDFNGANITFNTLAATITGTNYSIMGTNTTVTWASTGNAHFNTSGVTIFVNTNSTLIWSSTANNNGFNFNNKQVTFAGAGTMIFNDAFLANGQGAAHVMNMPGGKIILKQSLTSNYGATVGANFTITNGLFEFAAQTALADAFVNFVSGDTIKINGGALDNISGVDGTMNIGAGVYSIGGSFGYGGAGQNMSLGSQAVTLLVSPTITVNANTLTIAGPINDGGLGLGITKAGNGNLILSGANAYTGPNVVNGGMLSINTGSTSGGGYMVGDNGTLDVSVTAAGQTITATNLTIGATTGGNLQFDFSLLSNPNSKATAPVQLGTQTLTVNGTASTIGVGQLSAIPVYPLIIPVIAYGATSGNVSSLTLGAFPAATPAYQGYVSNDTVDAVIELVLTNGPVSQPPGNPKPVTWVGRTNGVNVGNWDSTTLNWTSSGVPTNYANLTLNLTGDPVTFDDTLTGTTNVILTTKLVPQSVTFNNNTVNYAFTGVGSLSGAGSLNMNGTGSLLLDNSGLSDFSGGITTAIGNVQIGNNDTNGNPGTGPISIGGGLIFNRTDTNFLVTPVISGGGSLTNNGTGTINLTAVETFTGATVVNAGKLGLSGPNATASGLSASIGLIINGPGIVQVNSDNALAGNGYGLPITINPGGVLTGNPTSDSGAGTSSHIHGTLTLSGGTLAMGGTSINLANGTWDLQGSPAVVVPGTNVTSTISALNVVPETGGGAIFNVTNGTAPSGIDLLVSGSLINGTSTHDGGVAKNGPGLMVLDNNNTYAAGTTVSGGTLQLGMPTDAAVLTTPLGIGGTVTLSANSVLNMNSGKGVVVSNSIFDDGTALILVSSGSNVLAGANNSYTGPTVVNSGATLALKNAATITSSAISVSNGTFDASSGGVISTAGSLSLTNSTMVLGTNLIAAIGTLGVSNSTLTFPVNANFANINVSGAFSTGGSTNIISLSAVPGFPVYPTNIVLIKYGSFAGDITKLGLQLPTLGSPVGQLINDPVNDSIDLALQSDTLTPIFPITWNGEANGVNATNWDLVTSNWVLTASPATGYPYQDLSVVTFDDSAQGSTAVNVTAAFAPASLTVSNAAKTYTFTGPGRLGGTMTLVKTNSGTAIFAESGGDNFIGGVSVGGGTLILSNVNVNIAGGLTVNNGTLIDQHTGTIAGGLAVNAGEAVLDQTGTVAGNTVIASGAVVQVGNGDAKGTLPNGTMDDEGGLVFNRTDTALAVTTVISGGGSMTNNGTGSVTLSATETMNGAIVVNAGTLVMNAGNNASPNGISAAGSLTINNGGRVTVLVDNSMLGHGAAGGSTAPILINAGGLLTGDASLAAGTSSHLPSLVTLNGGTLTNSGTSLQTANGSWDLEGGIATAGGPVTSTLGAFDMVPGESGGTHLTVLAPTATAPPSGIDLNVTGSLINGTSIHDTGVILDGTGTVAFSGTNTYILGTTLTSGVLIANAPENPGVSGPLGNTGLITFAGGTLKYSATNNFDYSARFAAGGLYNIDTAGRNVTYTTALNGGSVTKFGTGTLALTGANNYTGDTIVSRGTLATTTASVGPGNYTATNGSTLDVQVAAAGSQLTMNNLTLGSGASDTSTLQIDTLATGNPTAAPVNVTGSFTTAGTVNIALSGSALSANTFPLIAYAGASPSVTLQFVPPAGFTGSLSDNHAGLISVTISGAEGPTTNASITTVLLSGTNLVIHGTNNNVPGSNFHYVVLTTTNITTALSNWIPVVTNSFNSDGSFNYTNPVVPGTPQQYIDVKAVP
jgi:autotransporter-associated beta strand protein